jgi:hypothetical protein
MADYQGALYPVIAVHKEAAEIRVDGRLKRLSLRQAYRVERAPAFLAGHVDFKAVKASSRIHEQFWRVQGGHGYDVVPGGVISASGTYTATLVPHDSLPGCFLAVVFFRMTPAGSPDPDSTALAFLDVGDLVAGKETAVKVDCGYVVPGGTHFYFVSLLFSKGLEIQTDRSEASAGFFRYQEMVAHNRLLADYCKKNPGADRPLVPYLRFPPLLPEGLDPRTLPPMIQVQFVVTERGEVESMVLTPHLDPLADHAIRRAVGGWLFLPRLKAGRAVRTKIQLPLSFSEWEAD